MGRGGGALGAAEEARRAAVGGGRAGSIWARLGPRGLRPMRVVGGDFGSLAPDPGRRGAGRDLEVKAREDGCWRSWGPAVVGFLVWWWSAEVRGAFAQLRYGCLS